MKQTLKQSLKLFILMTFILGILYPLSVMGIGQLFFSNKVNGQLIEKNDKVVGSKLLGQTFKSDKYLHGRPQAVSQLSPASLEQQNIVKERIKKQQSIEKRTDKMPSDLAFASGSGLDPEISIEAAKYQIPRIAKQRQVTEKKVGDIINECTTEDGILLTSTKRVNVLAVNLTLDELSK